MGDTPGSSNYTTASVSSSIQDASAGFLTSTRPVVSIHKKSPRPPRIRCAITLEQPKVFTCLQGEDLLTSWIHCVRSHFALWKKNVFHQDLGPNNLTVRKDGTTIFGFVNDLDLARTTQSNDNSLTGALPFLAIIVLGMKSENMPLERFYYHDLESLIWILLWVILFVEAGREDPKDSFLASINTDHPDNYYQAKVGLLGKVIFRARKSKSEWDKLWPIGHELAKWVHSVHFDDNSVDTTAFNSLMEILERSKPVGYVMPVMPSVL